ncbi:MAG TPA: TetR/AcrR family transcriptional regulator [Plantibacter sp.]|uniref:TetR/AcrR family transcriptional regulator n=1 Tax=unclassified Plantibacter TaxID=2624265 RepID=UPI002C908180|nr:TetR/AcrR family transcriptional regulator [Plantibacter sp.]
MELTERQTELADAALRIIASSGMGALSFRAVATEDGCSLGSVQKAFPSKQRMLSAAFARLRDTAAPLPPGEPGRPTVRGWFVDLLIGVLPLDDARRAAQRQGDVFAQQALVDPEIASAITESDRRLRGLMASLVARGRQEGEIPAWVEPDTASWAILALAGGVAAQLTYDPKTEDEIRGKLETAVGALLGAVDTAWTPRRGTSTTITPS